jgi:hypothetical protein
MGASKGLWIFAGIAVLFVVLFAFWGGCERSNRSKEEIEPGPPVDISAEPPTHRWLVWHSDVLTDAGVVQGYMVAGTHIDVSEAGALVVHDKFGVVEMISPYMWSQCWRANPINMRNADRDTTEVFDE